MPGIFFNETKHWETNGIMSERPQGQFKGAPTGQI